MEGCSVAVAVAVLNMIQIKYVLRFPLTVLLGIYATLWVGQVGVFLRFYLASVVIMIHK